MKKILLVISATMLVGGSLFAQGTVTFGNTGTGTAISNGVTLAVLPSGTTFRAALYWLPYTPGNDVPPTWQEFDSARGTNVLTPNATSFILAGQFSAGTRTAPVPGASVVWFQVRAWEAAFGTSYEQARDSGQAALIGTSQVVKVKTGDPVNGIAPGSLVATPSPGFGGLKGFYVYPVPEPSLIGLGVLGVGALMLLRRRSK